MFSNLHDYRISRIFFVHCTKWENSDFTPRRTLMTQFFWTPHAVPRKPKNFRKIGGYLWIWSTPGRLFRVKIKPMQLRPHRTAHGFSHMIFTYLLTCWKMFQQALLKAFFHNMVMTLLIEHARTFLYMQELLHHFNTLDYAHQLHTVQRVHCLPGTEATPTKKGRSPRPYMYTLLVC